MKLRVLFVEDDQADMDLALHHMRKAGLDLSAHRVHSPQNLDQVLDSPEFDVALCDFRLPGWNGLDALRLLRTKAPQLPVVMLTGEITEERVLQARKLGASELVHKDRMQLLPAAVEHAVRSLREMESSRTALVQSEDRFRNIFAQAPTGIAVAGADGAFLQVNPAFCRIVGYSVPELLQMRWDHLLAPGSNNPFRTLSAMNQAAPALQADVQFRHRNGMLVDVQWNLCPLRHWQGKPMGHIGQISDITRRKQAEMKLKQYAMNLDRSNRDLQDFAYVASHDLQEPLRMVKSYLELLSRRYKGKLDQEADEFIGYAVDGATRMQSLITGLLAFSRINTQGKPVPQVDSGSCFQSALANLEVAVRDAGAKVTHQSLPALAGDPMQLTQLFQNLIANSLKFRSEQPPLIHVTAEREESGEYRFCVQDNGIGIDPKFHDRIFGMFQRLHGPARYPGSGIGLALCKRIVERHGGRIWVESKPDRGASFYFTLPEFVSGKDPLEHEQPAESVV